MKGKFSEPSCLSASALDLIHCILTKDPELRYRIKHIKKHPWFNLSQPVSKSQGIFVGYDQIPFDSNILSMMEALSLKDKRDDKLRIKFDKDHIIRCLEANKHTYETTIYYLLAKTIQEQ